MQDTLLPKTIPAELPGAVCQQWVKCGKPNCRCARGELHGPYWYRCWRDALGSCRKEYVRPADLEAVRAACAANRVEARKVNTMLVRGRRAVKWMTTTREERSAVPLMKQIELTVGLEVALHDLIALACGHGDRPTDSLRAFDVLTPALHPALRPSDVSAPSRSTGAIERIALGYDPADFTA